MVCFGLTKILVFTCYVSSLSVAITVYCFTCYSIHLKILNDVLFHYLSCLFSCLVYLSFVKHVAAPRCYFSDFQTNRIANEPDIKHDHIKFTLTLTGAAQCAVA